MFFSYFTVVLLLAQGHSSSAQLFRGGKGPEIPDMDPQSLYPSKIDFRLDPWLPQEDPQDTAQRLAMPSLTQA